MNIGIDVRPSLVRPTGVGSYVLALAQRLPASAPDHHFYYFSASLRDRYPIRTWPSNVTLVDRHLPVRALNFAWNRLGWPSLDMLARASLDLVHSPHPLLVPARKAKHIVTLHDLFFLKHPEMTEAEIRRDYAPLVAKHVRRADGVICVSEHTASEARLLLDVPPAKIAVIPNGVDPVYRAPIAPEAVDAVLARRRLPRGAILYVGSEERRKNLINLAMAYMGLARRRRKPTPPLVLIGPGSWWAQGGTDVGPAKAHASARAHRARLVVGAGRHRRRPADPCRGLSRDERDPRAHGRVGPARPALARGGVRPARRRRDGGGPSRRLLARLRARGGGRRGGHARESSRHEVDRRRHRARAGRRGARGRTSPERARAEPQVRLGHHRGPDARVLSACPWILAPPPTLARESIPRSLRRGLNDQHRDRCAGAAGSTHRRRTLPAQSRA